MDKKIYTDIKNALLRINDNIQEMGKQYHSYSSIYPFTNECISKYYNKNEIEGKDVLTVCSSGDHLLNAMLMDAKSVDCFDINKLSKYYMNLKIAGVKSLKYDEFLDFFMKSKQTMNKNTYKILREYLNDNIKNFWDEIFINYNGKNLRKSMLFSKDQNNKKSIIKSNDYLIPENYEILKNKISYYKPAFYHLDIKDLPDKINKKYDLIYLSNIVKYIDEIFDNPTLFEYKKFILNELSKILKDNGLIFLAYIYDYLSFDDGIKWCNLIDNYNERKKVFNKNEFDTRIFNSLYNTEDAVIVYKKELGKK